jgi:hypothetical protein
MVSPHPQELVFVPSSSSSTSADKDITLLTLLPIGQLTTGYRIVRAKRKA